MSERAHRWGVGAQHKQCGRGDRRKEAGAGSERGDRKVRNAEADRDLGNGIATIVGPRVKIARYGASSKLQRPRQRHRPPAPDHLCSTHTHHTSMHPTYYSNTAVQRINQSTVRDTSAGHRPSQQSPCPTIPCCPLFSPTLALKARSTHALVPLEQQGHLHCHGRGPSTTFFATSTYRQRCASRRSRCPCVRAHTRAC